MPLFTINISTRLSDNQFCRLLDTLNRIEQGVRKMGVNVDALVAVVPKLQQDVQNIIEKLNAPDVEAQAKIDEAVAALEAVDAALDAVAPDPQV